MDLLKRLTPNHEEGPTQIEGTLVDFAEDIESSVA